MQVTFIEYVDLRAMIPGEEIREKQKKHTNLMWFGGLSMSTGIRKKTFTIYQIRVI